MWGGGGGGGGGGKRDEGGRASLRAVFSTVHMCPIIRWAYSQHDLETAWTR